MTRRGDFCPIVSYPTKTFCGARIDRPPTLSLISYKFLADSFCITYVSLNKIGHPELLRKQNLQKVVWNIENFKIAIFEIFVLEQPYIYLKETNVIIECYGSLANIIDCLNFNNLCFEHSLL